MERYHHYYNYYRRRARVTVTLGMAGGDWRGAGVLLEHADQSHTVREADVENTVW